MSDSRNEKQTEGKAEAGEAVVARVKVEYPNGEHPSLEFSISLGQTVRLGRAKTNDVVLFDKDVSRLHAAMSASESGVVISDLASTNGTFVNGRRISVPVDLSGNSEVRLGNVRLLVSMFYAAAADDEEVGTKTELADLKAVEVTVLLVDVVSYTKMFQELPQEDVADYLRTWFDLVSAEIVAAGGEIDKYIGDCVMAMFKGSDTTKRQNALSAVEVAGRIVKLTETFGESWKYKDLYPWSCRSALNSGTALLGSVSSADRRNYTVLGDTINTAFRIEALGGKGAEGKLPAAVLVSESTKELVSPPLSLRPLGEFSLEGRTGTIKVFTLN